MTSVALPNRTSLRDRISAEEWQVRVDLAACYRMVARNGWDDGIFTHNSARVPGVDDHFLLNPYGLMFSEITASSLVKVDVDGRVIDPPDAEIINAGFTIHSAIHMSRHDALCVMHTHTIAGMAVSAQACGLLPLNQKSMRFFNRIAYHDYEGIADNLEERERLVEDIGNCRAMILKNHGLLTAGRTIAEAFTLMRYLQNACELQIAAQAGGELTIPPPSVCERVALQFDRSGDNQCANDASWAAYKRSLDREEPDYME
ncbi:MAG: class II aldolase [Magnetovibrio sp.]|nr:class II aldolase [Magnetovibrio sp.]